MFENLSSTEDLIPENQSENAMSEDEIRRFVHEAIKKSEKKIKKSAKKAKKAAKKAKKAQKAAEKSNTNNCKNKEKTDKGRNELFTKIKEAVINAIPQIIVSIIKKAINSIGGLCAKKRGFAA